ncbi:tumor necrosis factor ligand superfamily member 10-like isoform X7 [Oncorhynchus keta]|uniref:tumor necrosis factor ligand superfamily member 10-like isoform X7 n=1 Tax=Oncorhynchus keta TaxID=8018 RepID=UPI00227D43FC|nr:tumor necrosis factor ligand superfamily member 10-like isoform X7 [Oncorhynchus keta]
MAGGSSGVSFLGVLLLAAILVQTVAVTVTVLYFTNVLNTMKEMFARSSVSCLTRADLRGGHVPSSTEGRGDPCWQVTQQLHILIEKVTHILIEKVTHILIEKVTHTLIEKVTHILIEKVTHILIEKVTHTLIEKVTHTLIEKVTHILIEKVTHTLIEKVTHTLIEKVTHTLIEKVTHTLIEKVTHILIEKVTHTLIVKVTHILIEKVTHTLIEKVTHILIEKVTHILIEKVTHTLIEKVTHTLIEKVTHILIEKVTHILIEKVTHILIEKSLSQRYQREISSAVRDEVSRVLPSLVMEDQAPSRPKVAAHVTGSLAPKAEREGGGSPGRRVQGQKISWWEGHNGLAFLQEVRLVDGELVVPRPGLYYIYAQTYFRHTHPEGEEGEEEEEEDREQRGRPMLQYVYKKVSSYPVPILLMKTSRTSCWSRDSQFSLHSAHQGGLFPLAAGDHVLVTVSNVSAIDMDERSSFFGAFLVS